MKFIDRVKLNEYVGAGGRGGKINLRICSEKPTNRKV